MRYCCLASLYAISVVLAGGCATPSSVVVKPRRTPDYSNPISKAPANMCIVVYPALEAGDSETRAMRLCGFKALVKGLKVIGYDVASAELSRPGDRNVCVVEIAECRHDMPEWTDNDIASLVTVIAVRVRMPGIMRDGCIDCGNIRSFQGVYRTQLGRRLPDFQVSETERDRGIEGAVSCLVGLAAFNEAICACCASNCDFCFVPGGADMKEKQRKEKNEETDNWFRPCGVGLGLHDRKQERRRRCRSSSDDRSRHCVREIRHQVNARRVQGQSRLIVPRNIRRNNNWRHCLALCRQCGPGI